MDDDDDLIIGICCGGSGGSVFCGVGLLYIFAVSAFQA